MADPVFNYISNNPFNLNDVGHSSPTFADIDDDKDLDFFLGNFTGDTFFFVNNGTASNPFFAPAITNPFGMDNVGGYASPTLADIDGDGDLDAFIGNSDGNLLFFKNTGTTRNPFFAPAITNPFGMDNVGGYASPTLADIDGDGDLDVFIGNADNNILYFKNTGTGNNPVFAPATANTFGLFGLDGYGTSLTFTDIDGDGDLDAFVGEGGKYNSAGGIMFFRNTGTASNAVFYSDSMNPFGLDAAGAYKVKPIFVDIDNDRDIDAFVGSDNRMMFFQNAGIGYIPYFSGMSNFGLKEDGYFPNPTFADIDGDGDLDAFVGRSYNIYDDDTGDTLFYENTGTASMPVFTTPETNPFGLSNVGLVANPTFKDINNDGDLDAFIGNDTGNTIFFENTGTINNPIFAPAVTNPFGLVNIDNEAKPVFVDIDADNDQDVFVNNLFFQNIGTASNPLFDESIISPFGLDGSSFAFIDADSDGDFDAFTNNLYIFFRNTGTASKPIFSMEPSPYDLPSAGYRGEFTSRTLVDIDGDGDLDIYVTGSYYYAGSHPWEGFFSINNHAPNVANLNAAEIFTAEERHCRTV